ncbi:McrC family protein [Sphingopyxis granuli]|uniref:McrC family protein n=1 Tax=Sphingopyxis granuli TaxID=267128 RepID=UPI001F53804F|nr:McrC family protein [Sphingopyxis granuli]UNK78046.1 McrC family protein [Sphingopyxis granuli]
MKLVARDCSPLIPQPTATEAAWLRRLATNVRAADLVVPVSGARDEDEPVVYCAWDGTWWAGRYVGSLSFDGHSLTIKPRFGLATLQNWLFEATSVVLTDAPGKLREDESFIAQLLASVWAHGFVAAARHGLPALRRDVATKGRTIRGRLDVASSLRLIATGGGQVVSIRSERSLDHAASNAIVAAYEALRRWLGVRDEQWMPARAKELIPHLMSVTGARPRVPTKAELARIRYTPITASFAPIAELSRQIANRRGLAADIDASAETKGVLLDVAELWEMYVLSVLRKAAAPLTVTHGTREKTSTKKLLHSDITGQGLGTLIPDAILYAGGNIQGVADAKYKSLHPSARAPNGPQREDLYQMAAYLGRFAPPGGRTSWGVLAYPQDPARPLIPQAEQFSPWSLDGGRKVVFTTLPHVTSEAVTKLRSLVAPMATD